MRSIDRHQAQKGRGAVTNPAGRFESTNIWLCDDGWGTANEVPRRAETMLQPDHPRRAITTNQSPDVPFDQSLNPYQGCEHGCIYCFARPTHAYWNLGAGLDFETRLFYKPTLPELLDRELSAPGYRCRTINLGANTDPYQPAEREHRISRRLLEVLLRHRHPVTIVTKGALIVRDLDLLGELAERRLVKVFVSLTTLDDSLKRVLEPRAASPRARLAAIRSLTDAGVPVGALLAPVIPALTDHEIENLVEAAAGAGALTAGFVLLRLPFELAELFEQWLREHYPDRAGRVLNRIREMRGGALNDPRFGHRMRGSGPYAELLGARFAAACRRSGLEERRVPGLDSSHFIGDLARPAQGELFASDAAST